MSEPVLRIRRGESGALELQFEDGDGAGAWDPIAIDPAHRDAFEALRDRPSAVARLRAHTALLALLQSATTTWTRLGVLLPRSGDELPPCERLLVESSDDEALELGLELLAPEPEHGVARALTDSDRFGVSRLVRVAAPSVPPVDRDPRTLVVVGSTSQSLVNMDARPPLLDQLGELARVPRLTLAIPVGELRLLRERAARSPGDRAVQDLLDDAQRCRPLASVAAALELLRVGIADSAGVAPRPFDLVVLLGHSIERSKRATWFDLGLKRDGDRPAGPGFDELAGALAHGETRLCAVLACMVGAPAIKALLRSVDHVLASGARITSDDASAALGVLRESLLVERAPIERVVRRMRRALSDTGGWALLHATRTTAQRVLADPLAIGLRQYLNRVRDDCVRDLRDSLVGGRLELLVQEAIALRGEDPGAREEFMRRRARRGGDGDPLGPTTLRRLIESLRREPGPRYLVVLGRPGGGKSVLILHLAHELAADDAMGRIPVLLRLRELADDDARGSDPLKQVLGRQRGCRADEIVEADPALIALRRAADCGRVLFLLDGVDELPPARRDEFLNRARALGADGRCTVVLTSRPIGFTCPTGFRELWLQALDAERQRELVQKRHGADAARIWQALEPQFASSPSLEHLAATPLFLTLLSDLAKEGEPIASRELDVLEQLLESLVEQRNKPARLRASLQFRRSDSVLAVLRSLALAMTQARRAVWGEAELRTWSRSNERPADAEAALRTSGDWAAGGWTEFLIELATRTGILIAREEGGRRSFEFRHRAFQEALCARAVIERHPQLDLAQVKALIDAREGAEAEDLVNFWAEPLGLLAAEVASPDAWILGLVAEKHTKPIALRAVASARQLGDDAVLGVVEQLGKWWERVSVYDQLLERVDRKRVLALIEKLAARTTNGIDLWHLRDLCRRLARAGLAAAGVRVFEHLPAPAPGLFDRIPRGSGQREREPLWKRGPAGRFRMGEGNDTAEVSIPAPFWIMAVPVTAAMYRVFDPGKRHAWGEDPLLPQTELTWFEADAFCAWLNSHRDAVIAANPELADAPAEYVFRLPDEAEWEYACRAGTTTAFWSGDEPRDAKTGEWIAWFLDNPETKGRVHPVAVLPANPWGLHDMHGNVWEWSLEDWVDRALRDRAHSSGLWQRSVSWDRGRSRVLRGGSCWNEAWWCRSANRNWNAPDVARVVFGFRLVLSAPVLG
ncbi:MAG: SUMF1/EgtB/PvdO family nonheme iron enzyme [Planctomycetes bacterium]|nr:SUMF1/EgtB/PvdO family nonheme iron enzyme [Planctomycetota bacterium]